MTDPGVQPVDSSQSLQKELEELRKANDRLRKENDVLSRRLAEREGLDQKATASEVNGKPAEEVQVPDVAESVATGKPVTASGNGQVAEGPCPAEPHRPPRRGKAPGPPPARGKARGQFPPKSNFKGKAAQGQPKAAEPTARPVEALDSAKLQPEGAEQSAAAVPSTDGVAPQDEERNVSLRKRLALALGPMGGAISPPQLGDLSVEDILLRNGNPNTKIVKCLEVQLLLQREVQAVEDFAKNGALLDEDDRKEFALPSRGDIPLGKRLFEELGGSVFSSRLLPRACLLEDPALRQWFEVQSSSKDGDKSKPTALNSSSSGPPGGARSAAAPSGGGGSRQSLMGPGLQQSINIGLSSMKRSFGTRENVMEKLQLAVLECALEPASCDKLTQMIPKASANSERYAAWKAGTGKVKQLVEADPSVQLFEDEQLALFADTFKDLHKRLEVVQHANEDAFRRNVKEIRQAIDLKLSCLAMLRSRKDRLQQFFADTLWVCLWLNNAKPTSHGGTGHNWFKWRTVLPKLEKHLGFDDSGQQAKEHSLLRFLARHCGDILEPEDAEALRKATQQPLESVASTAFRCIEKWFELREVDIERLGSYSGNGLDQRDQLLSRLAVFVTSTSTDVLKLILSFARLLKEYGVAVVWLGDTAPFFPVLRTEAESHDGGLRDSSSARRGSRDDQDADMLMALRQFFESYAKALAGIRKGGTKRPRELVGVESSPTSGSSTSSDSSPSPSSRCLPLSAKRRKLGVFAAIEDDASSSEKPPLSAALSQRPKTSHPFPMLLLRARGADRKDGGGATRLEGAAEDSDSLSDPQRLLHAQQQPKPSVRHHRHPTTPTRAASCVLPAASRPLAKTQLAAAVAAKLQSLTTAGGAGQPSSAKAGGESNCTTPQVAAAEASSLFRVTRSDAASTLSGAQAALAAAGRAAVAAHNAALREGLPAAPLSSYRLRLAEIRAAREAAAQAIAASASPNAGTCSSSTPQKVPRGESATAKAAVAVGTLASSPRPAGRAEGSLAGSDRRASSEGARRSSAEDGRDDRLELFNIAGEASATSREAEGHENNKTTLHDGCISEGESHESPRRCHLDDELPPPSAAAELRGSRKAANRSDDTLSPIGRGSKGVDGGGGDDDVTNPTLLSQHDNSPKWQRLDGKSSVTVLREETMMPHAARLAVCEVDSRQGSPMSLAAIRATRTSLCASTPRRPTPSSRPPNRAAVEGSQERASPGTSSVQASPSSVASTVVDAPVPSLGSPMASPTRRANDEVEIGRTDAPEKGGGRAVVDGVALDRVVAKKGDTKPLVQLEAPSNAIGNSFHSSSAETGNRTASPTPLSSSPDRRPPIVFDPSADFEAWINDL